MMVLYVMIPIAILIVLVFLASYIWAVRDGQFDDLQTPSYRILEENHEHRKL